MIRREDESYLSYAKRLTNAKKDGIISYQELGDYLLKDENVYSEDNIRKFYYIFDKILKYLDGELILDSEDARREVERIKYEIVKERKKLQTINLEYNANAREEARLELFQELIVGAVERLQPIKIVPTTYTKRDKEVTGLLLPSDAHYGKELTIKGLYGEVVNQYSVEIFKSRMWHLLSQLENDSFDMKIDKLIIADCGDAVEGILRCTSTLQKLKVGVLDSALEYAEFMAIWLAEVYNRLHIPVEYTLTGGNHDIVRILSSKKDFDEENVGKVILKHINLRMENAKLKAKLEYGIEPQIEIKEYSDVCYHNIYGMNVLTYHGDSKNLKEDIEFFENFYQIDIDILYTGHLHRSSQETIGIGFMGDREIVRVPSIIGMDDYSKSIRKLARAGVKFETFTEDGKGWGKTYFLN